MEGRSRGLTHFFPMTNCICNGLFINYRAMVQDVTHFVSKFPVYSLMFLRNMFHHAEENWPLADIAGVPRQ